MFGHNLNPHYFANPPAFTYVLHLLFAVWFGGGAGARHAFALVPRRGLHARARDRRAARHGGAVAAVRDGRASVQSWRRPARGRDRGGRVSARLLRAPGAERRAHARPGDAVVVGERGGVEKRSPARLPAGGDRAGAGLREQVHRRDRRVAAAGGRRDALSERPTGRPRISDRPPGGDRSAARGRERAGGLPGREPLRGARLPELPLRTGASVDALRRSPGQARRATGGRAFSTTCGR